MNKGWLKVLRIITFTFGIAAALTLPAGSIASNAVRSNYNQKIDNLRYSFTNIAASYKTFGPGKETDNVINGFLSSIPGTTDMESNIVIVDPAGTIQYKLNDNYLQTNSGKISMAWNYYNTVSIDQAGEGYWYRMDWLGGWDVGTYPKESDGIDIFGLTGYPTAKLTDMLGLSYLVQKPEAVITIYDFWENGTGTGDNGQRSCVMWIRNANAYDAALAGTFYIENITTPAGILLLLLYWLLAPVYVFLDARRRQTQPLPWALLVLITNIVGMIVYWIVQTQNGKAASGPACPACGRPVRKGHLFCPWCAAPLVKNCAGCGKPLEQGWVACPWCGKPTE